MSVARRALPQDASRRGWCPSLARPMPTGDGLLARVHPPLGALSIAQLRAVAEGAQRFGNGHVDVTARGNLQIRGVRPDTAHALAAWLDEAGLGDVRDDGGPQRLTLTSPLAGLETEDTIDVLALARTLEAGALGLAGLPAKTLIAIVGPGVSGDGADLVIQPGAAGCLLALAGDSGRAAEVPPTEAAEAVMAILDAFAATGQRRVRDLSEADRTRVLRAASRHLKPSLRASAKQSSRRDLSGAGNASQVCFTSLAMTGRGEGASMWPDGSSTGLVDRAGFVVLFVEAPFGRCTADHLDCLVEAAERTAASEIRTTPTRGFALPGRDRESASAASATLAVAGFITRPDDPRRAIAACPGAQACASGTTPVPEDANALAKAFAPFATRGFKAHVSGCTKGCAHPAAADLTFVADRGTYDVILHGDARGEPAMRLTFEAALERVRRADPADPLADAFRP